jgi:hypothetical protein
VLLDLKNACRELLKNTLHEEARTLDGVEGFSVVPMLGRGSRPRTPRPARRLS